ncbi:MAG: hypothetical protein NVS3B21_06220 [Acidimicrobiales bacterium]
MASDQQIIQEATSFARAALDDDQIIGTEDTHPERAEQIAGPPQRLTIDLYFRTAPERDRPFDQQITATPRTRCSHDGLVRPAADERIGRGAPERVQRGQPSDRLDQVGLPLAVAPGDDSETRGREADRSRPVIPEIGQPELVELQLRRLSPA